MKKNQFKKRYITLVEMMIVMFLIAMITGVIAYNYTGSLDQGKAFKTQAGMEKIRTILDLHLATNPGDNQVATNWKGIVEASPLVKNVSELTKDGWGAEYKVSLDNNGDIEIISDRFNEYSAGKGSSGMFKNKSSQTQ